MGQIGNYLQFRRQSIFQILLPVLLAIITLICVYIFLLLPIIEEKLVESKKESITDMVSSAVSVVDSYYNLIKSDSVSVESAKSMAEMSIKNIRYGTENNDYFWILDLDNNKALHPFSSDKNLVNYSDKLGRFPAMQMRVIASEGGKGFLEYTFQYNNDTSRHETKISYVSLFAPWNWVIGTGFYRTDIEARLTLIKRDISNVIIIIIFLVLALLTYMLYRSVRNAKAIFEREQIISLNESRFRGLAQNIDNGVFIIENDETVYVNDRFRAIFNFHDESLNNFNFANYVNKKNVKLFNDYTKFKENISGGNKEIICWISLDRDGKKRITATFSYIHQIDTNIVYVVINDTTEIYKNNIKLNQLSQAIQQSPSSIIITDVDGKFEYVNPGFERITGYKAKEVIGQSTRILNSGKTPNAVYSDLWKTIKSGQIWENELINKNRKGELIWLSTIISPLVNENNEIINFVAIQVDITNRKTIEGELIKAKEKAESGERLKAAFITNVSHEVRTPLNAIYGFAQLFKALLKPDDKNYEYAHLIERNSKILLKLFDDILEYSKIEANTLEFKAEPHDINVLLAKLASKYNTKNISDQEKPIEIILEQGYKSDEFELKVDKYYFTKILDNLVYNSLKFTEAGVIKVGYVVNIDYIEFFVKDTGVGISDSDKSIVFDAFSHGTKKFVTLHKGTGLGLSITKQLVQQMGGSIWFSSEEDKGTSFHFTLPIDMVVSKEDIEEDPFEFIRGKTVLVAEDNQHSYLLLEAILNLTGVKIIWAHDGNEAITKVENSDKIDIILMDIMMPEMDGIKATQIVKKSHKNIPIVALTAVDDKVIDREKDLFDGFIRKPVSKDKLVKLLLKLIK